MEANWQPPETAPRDGSAFLITTAGPNIDICVWRNDHFEDYSGRQTVEPRWPYLVGWAPLPRPAKVLNSEPESRRANGWA